MKFTLKMLLPPFILFVLLGLYSDTKGHAKNWEVLGIVIMIWGFIAFVICFFYWITRAFRRATRDSQPYR